MHSGLSYADSMSTLASQDLAPNQMQTSSDVKNGVIPQGSPRFTEGSVVSENAKPFSAARKPLSRPMSTPVMRSPLANTGTARKRQGAPPDI
jgi:hypothetical protein